MKDRVYNLDKRIKKGKKKHEKELSALDGNFKNNLNWMTSEEDNNELILLDDKKRDDCANLLRLSIEKRREQLMLSGFDTDFEIDRYFTEEDQRADSDLSTFVSTEVGREILFPSKILSWLSELQLKLLYITSARIDITNNIEKCNMIKYILGPSFKEIGAGTNRIAFKKDNYVLKLALDPRGVIDNMMEFCRSQDFPEDLAKTYETNVLSNIQEYATICSEKDYMTYEFQTMSAAILQKFVEEGFFFDDLCLGSKKNFTNWGYRIPKKIGAADILKRPVVVDYGYFYDLKYNPNIMRCSICGELLSYNKDFTSLICKNKHKIQVSDKRDEMGKEMELRENKAIFDMTGVQLPTIDDYSKFLYGREMKGEYRDKMINAISNTFRGLSEFMKDGDF